MNIKKNNNEYDYLHNWVELSKSALDHNIQQFSQWLGPDTNIAGVIKSNAYGHGLLEIAQLYQRSSNIFSLCVINLTEAITVRAAGINKPIIVIGYLDQPYDLIIKHDIQVVVYDSNIAIQLNATGQKFQTKINIHIKFDTGMSRLGITFDKLDDFIEEINALPWLHIIGIFSHLGQSYLQEPTDKQNAIFNASAMVQTKQYITHIANSHGSLQSRLKKYSFARVGIGLYGYLQKESVEKQKLLRPVLSLKTKILQVKLVTAETCIGYDGMFTAPCDMTIATIAIGYAEGLDARLSNQGFVIVHGQKVAIIGRICMNLTIIDISKISECAPGDVVTLLGSQGNCTISTYDWSAITGASAYNLLTKISSTVARIIVE